MFRLCLPPSVCKTVLCKMGSIKSLAHETQHGGGRYRVQASGATILLAIYVKTSALNSYSQEHISHAESL